MATLYGDSEHPIVEMLIDGAWTDVSARVRNAQRVSITRGRADEQSRVAAQRAILTVDNADGFFSTRLPSSVNYRKIGKNTQLRVRAGDGDSYMRTLYNDSLLLAGAQCPDQASLDITGDIDIRADIWPHSWRPAKYLMLAAKYATLGDNRAWVFRLNVEGKLMFAWSPTGAFANLITITSTAAITPPDGGRLSVRVTLDVNNGASGNTVTFYTSDSVTGTWTTLGAPVVTAGVTSIDAGTAVLSVGRTEASQGGFSSGTGFGGRFYRFQLRDGIGGTLVADFNPEAQGVGATSWSDGLAAANTWTVSGLGARVTSDRVRFWGEAASIQKEWDHTGRDVIAPVQAAGMLRRLSQGVKPLDSAMTRNFKGVSTFAHWPLEDESGAASAANLAPGLNPEATIYAGTVTEATLGSTDSPPGAKSALSFSSSASRFVGNILLKEQEAPAVYSLVFYVKLDALPASNKVFFSMRLTGQISRVDVGLSGTAWTIAFYDILDSVIASANTTVTLINPVNGWIGYNLLWQDSGSDMTYSQRWDTIGAFGGGTGPTTIAGQYAAAPSRVTFTAANDAVFEDLKISHVFLSSDELDLTDDTFRDASNAYRGETAAARLARLSAEEGVPIEITGLLADSETMGYQTIKTYPDLIAECWEADGGIGGEARDALTLEYRTRVDLEAREDLVLDHSAHDLSEVPRPTDDDLNFTNDVTVTRAGGSSARAIITEGFTSISEPPDGVGRYNSDTTLNVASDARLPSIAGWLALTGSWDQDRYPGVQVALHRARVLADDALYRAVVGARLGDTLTLAELPAWMPPDRVPQIIQGYTEQLSRFLWDVDFNCTPAGPYQSVGVLASDISPPRLDATGHTIGSGINSSATSISLVTPAGSAVWADSAGYAAEFPIDIVISGEVMSLTAVTGTSSPQTGTVTRSVNGVVKSHDAGASVRLARPFYIGR